MAEKKSINVGIYARVSRDEQNLDNQLLILRDAVKEHNDKVREDGKGIEWITVDEYTDKLSGANASRPGINRLMQDAEDGKINLILATKIDRIARSSLNLANICAKLDKWQVGLKFIEQPIDFTSPEGRLLRTFLGAIAEFELELIHSRTKDGQARARKEGKIIGRPKTVLSDYQIQKAREILAANPDISQRQFADQFIGIGRRQLIEELRKLGIWTK